MTISSPIDTVIHELTRPQLYVQAVGFGVVIEFRTHSMKSDSP